MYHMRSNPPCFPDSSRGSIILISSTSGYFGSSGVASYISSKHGVTGVLRASQGAANQLGIRVNGIAPFYTPTHMTSGYSALWSKSSVPGNTVDDLAQAIAQTAMDSSRRGKCFLVSNQRNPCAWGFPLINDDDRLHWARWLSSKLFIMPWCLNG